MSRKEVIWEQERRFCCPVTRQILVKVMFYNDCSLALIIVSSSQILIADRVCSALSENQLRRSIFIRVALLIWYKFDFSQLFVLPSKKTTLCPSGISSPTTDSYRAFLSKAHPHDLFTLRRKWSVDTFLCCPQSHTHSQITLRL